MGVRHATKYIKNLKGYSTENIPTQEGQKWENVETRK